MPLRRLRRLTVILVSQSHKSAIHCSVSIVPTEKQLTLARVWCQIPTVGSNMNTTFAIENLQMTNGVCQMSCVWHDDSCAGSVEEIF
jgi:hypothetical protein